MTEDIKRMRALNIWPFLEEIIGRDSLVMNWHGTDESQVDKYSIHA